MKGWEDGSGLGFGLGLGRECACGCVCGEEYGMAIVGAPFLYHSFLFGSLIHIMLLFIKRNVSSFTILFITITPDRMHYFKKKCRHFRLGGGLPGGSEKESPPGPSRQDAAQVSVLGRAFGCTKDWESRGEIGRRDHTKLNKTEVWRLSKVL